MVDCAAVCKVDCVVSRDDYRAMLRIQGPVWCEYTYHHDWMNIPFWALDALHDYLTGKDAP